MGDALSGRLLLDWVVARAGGRRCVAECADPERAEQPRYAERARIAGSYGLNRRGDTGVRISVDRRDGHVGDRGEFVLWEWKWDEWDGDHSCDADRTAAGE